MKDLNLFIALSRTMLYIDREADKVFQKYHITKTQFAVMEALYHKGPLTQSDIRRLILTTTGNLPVVIKNLLTYGYVEKRKDKPDKRKQILSLTLEGQALMGKVFPENRQCIEKIFSVWTQEEKEHLMNILQKFRKEYYGNS